MRQLAIVAVVRGRAPRLVEWLAFHRAVGVRDVVIYDEGPRDETAAILAAHAALGVIRVPWPEARANAHLLTPQNHFLASYARLFAFAVFLDTDEFLVPPPGGSVAAWLRDVPAYAGAVRLPVCRFADPGAASGLVLGGLPAAPSGPGEPERRHPVRAVYRRGAVAGFVEARVPDLVQGEWLNGDGPPTQGRAKSEPEGIALQLHRYDATAAVPGTSPCLRTQAWIGPTRDEMRHLLVHAQARPEGGGSWIAALQGAVPDLAEPVRPLAHRRWRWDNLNRRWLEGAVRFVQGRLRPRSPPW
ncbi:glycosyltransferase family 2 protein [Methylobacterium sp. Leaf118]|uniref:glycosyltransferase family 2 protein n=1 Tax=Methylobacterium sp. Leaf118 TaxID=2876562 RepID=UPI001E54DC97|nr:glycosyltransferase family 2 protein [Methylobacterium sp. Leaf118]